MKTSSKIPLPFSLTASPDGKSAALEFENARSLQAHHAGDEGLLRRMEEMLHVHITSRDGWMRIEGEPDAVSKAAAIFTQLGKVTSLGGVIGRDEFLFALGHPGGVPEEGVPREVKSPVEELYDERIQCSPRKPPILPKSESQRDYVRAIDTHDITFGIGPAGTGKTYLAVAKAVAALKAEKVSRIILTRPAVEADEAQNTTTEQMFMFLTRIGIGSKCVITGDRTQIDLPKNKPSGLIEAAGALKGTPGIAFHLFGDRDVVRHPLVQAIIAAYKEHRGNRESRL